MKDRPKRKRQTGILKDGTIEVPYEQKCSETEITEAPEQKVFSSNDKYVEWILRNGNSYYPTRKIKLVPTLLPGSYNISWDGSINEYYFLKKSVFSDELYVLPNGIFETILEDLDYFWKNIEKFKKYGYNHKRGLLLYGEPGNGKTCLTSLISNQVEKLGGLIFNIRNGNDLRGFLEAVPFRLREIQSNTPIVVMIEDLDGLVANPELESELLNLLDGINQLEHCVYIGCTNYPEKLKERILNRPNRFDKRYYIGNPDRTVREFYFKKKIKKEDLDSFDFDLLLDKTEGLSLSHCGELIKSVFIFEKDLEESIEELQDMGKFISSTQFAKKQNNIGFKK